MPRVTVIPSTIDALTKAPLSIKKKRRVCAYARVSTDKEDQENSFEAQQRVYTKMINNNPDWEFIRIYADEGISGTSIKKRDQFKQMIEDAKAGKFDLLINKSISRFGRNTVDTLNTVRLLQSLGIEVYFEKENISTFDSKGEFILTIMASLAQEESRSISNNVKMGKRWGYQNGKFSIPYGSFLGYKKGEDGKIAIDENEAATVREIYRMFLVEGMTPGGIAKELKRRGIKTARQKDSWSKVGLMSILTNEKYKGDALLQKGYVENFLEHKTIKNNGILPQYYVENSHPYIIEKEMWELVQLEIERRNKIGAAYSASDIFAAKLICEDCGGFYGRKVWHSGSKYQSFIYQCNRKFDKSTKKYKCQTPHLYENDIKDKFVKAYNIVMGDKEFIIEDLKDLIELLTDTSEIDDNLIKWKVELDTVHELAVKLIDGKAKSKENDANFDKTYSEYQMRHETARTKIESLQKEKQLRIAKKTKMETYLKYVIDHPDHLLEWNESTWRLMVESAVVHKDKTITFKFYNGREVRV